MDADAGNVSTNHRNKPCQTDTTSVPAENVLVLASLFLCLDEPVQIFATCPEQSLFLQCGQAISSAVDESGSQCHKASAPMEDVASSYLALHCWQPISLELLSQRPATLLKMSFGASCGSSQPLSQSVCLFHGCRGRVCGAS